MTCMYGDGDCPHCGSGPCQILAGTLSDRIERYAEEDTAFARTTFAQAETLPEEEQDAFISKAFRDRYWSNDTAR